MKIFPKELINEWYKKEYSNSTDLSIYGKPKKKLIQFFKIIKKRAHKSILDLGCGDGRNLFELARRGFVVTGIDMYGKEAILKRQNKENVKIKFLKADIKKFPFDRDKYDVIICSEVLHLIERKYLDSIIKKIKNALNPNGLIYIDILTNLKRVFLKTNRPFKYEGQADYSNREIKEFFKRTFNDYKIIELGQFHDEQNWPLKKGKYPIEPYHWNGDYVYIIAKK